MAGGGGGARHDQQEAATPGAQKDAAQLRGGGQVGSFHGRGGWGWGMA